MRRQFPQVVRWEVSRQAVEAARPVNDEDRCELRQRLAVADGAGIVDVSGLSLCAWQEDHTSVG